MLYMIIERFKDRDPVPPAGAQCGVRESAAPGGGPATAPVDLTLPYTLYPSALPPWLAWILFALALGGAVAASVAIARRKTGRLALLAFVPLLIGLLIASMVGSAVLMFFLHDV